MYCIGTPPNYPSKNRLAIVDSGTNIRLSKQDTKTMAPVIILSYMVARLTNGSTMESLHMVTIQLPCISKQARQTHILSKIKNPH